MLYLERIRKNNNAESNSSVTLFIVGFLSFMANDLSAERWRESVTITVQKEQSILMNYSLSHYLNGQWPPALDA